MKMDRITAERLLALIGDTSSSLDDADRMMEAGRILMAQSERSVLPMEKAALAMKSLRATQCALQMTINNMRL